MTYQHQGKRFVDPINGESYNKENIGTIKRFFILQFVCMKCNKSSRLKELKLNFMEKFQCPYCKEMGFGVEKTRTGESSLKSKDSIIIVENRRFV